MAVDGNWKITLSTPMGPQDLTATFATQGDAFTGKAQNPMLGEMDFAGKVDGDKMTGDVKLGAFGSATLTGVRI